jgi:3-hydroxyisobutyrate dehydrogenase
MANIHHRLGWIGLGRMGKPMAEALLATGHDVALWNRTRARAEAVAKQGGRLVERACDLGDVDILFTMVATGKVLADVYFGENGVAAAGGSNKIPRIFVDCSSIGIDESADFRRRLAERGAQYVAAPVSGNGKCVKVGKLSAVLSGAREACETAKPYVGVFAKAGVSYVGEDERARICKIAHNVMLGVVIQSLAEITILAQKHGVPRHTFLDFMNNSVLGSTFTRYKSNALVNLDWTTTFTPELLRKDLDLGLAAGRKQGVAMPLAAATREALQAHFGAASLNSDPQAYIEGDFAALIETVALAAGIRLESEHVPVPSGLEIGH